MNIDKIHDALETIRSLLTKQNGYMKAPLDMVIGGLVIPAMVKEDADLLDDESVKDMIRQYSRANIEKMLSGKETEVVEKVVEVEKVVKVIEQNKKHRRLKNGYAVRPKKMKRVLAASDREIVIRWWNQTQRLSAGKDDPICEELAAKINQNVTAPEDKLAAYQVNGFISHLARLGLKLEKNREDSIEHAMARGDYSIRPIYTQSLIRLIIETNNRNKDDKKKGKAERAVIQAARAA